MTLSCASVSRAPRPAPAPALAPPANVSRSSCFSSLIPTKKESFLKVYRKVLQFSVKNGG